MFVRRPCFYLRIFTAPYKSYYYYYYYYYSLVEVVLRLCLLFGVGSPLQYTVGKTPVGGTHKVEFGGAGAERGAIGIKSKFLLHTCGYWIA